MLLQQQQTTAPGTFETLCGNFLSQRLKRTVVGGKGEKEILATHNTNLMYVDENGKGGRGGRRTEAQF